MKRVKDYKVLLDSRHLYVVGKSKGMFTLPSEIELAGKKYKVKVRD